MGLIALIKNFRKLGFKEFMRKWKRGIQSLSPLALLRTELTGIIGTIFGSIACMIFFIYINFWVICIPLGFSLLIQISNLFGKLQQFWMLKELNKEREIHIKELGLEIPIKNMDLE